MLKNYVLHTKLKNKKAVCTMRFHTALENKI